MHTEIMIWSHTLYGKCRQRCELNACNKAIDYYYFEAHVKSLPTPSCR